jgi:hypothetical protein
MMRQALLRATFSLCLAIPVACKSEAFRALAEAPEKDELTRLRYQFAPGANVSTMTVGVCFEGRVPRFLDAQMPAARSALVAARRSPGNAELALAADGLDLSALAPGDCIELALDLDQAARTSQNRRKLRRHGRDLFVSPDYFLWRPSGSLDQVDITATFELPAGMTAFVPWPRTAPGGAYRVPVTSFHWGIQAALGYFEPETFEIGGARVHVAILGDSWRVERHVLLDWLKDAARAVSLLWDEFPVPEAHVILYPVDSGSVGFGWATRGGGPGIAIGVGKDATAAALRDDWVAVHEMLHLGTPTIEDDSRWLTEGLATYYEPLLRAQAGLLEPHQPWEILHEGFGRGARQGQSSDLTLLEESDAMDQTRRYWRVYWSGAAIALLTDVALRQRGSSLDQELARMRDCCLDSSRALTAEELLRSSALPAPHGEALPSLAAVAAPFLDSKEFPDLAAAYEALDLSFDSEGKLEPTADQRAGALRASMTARPDRID